jgi:hypothetical protein
VCTIADQERQNVKAKFGEVAHTLDQYGLAANWLKDSWGNGRRSAATETLTGR